MTELMLFIVFLFWMTALNVSFAQRQFFDEETFCMGYYDACEDLPKVFHDDELYFKELDEMDYPPFPSEDLFDAPSPDEIIEEDVI